MRRVMWCRLVIAAIVMTTATLACGPRAEAGPRTVAVWPVPGEVVRPFRNPEPRWKPGHRGVDLEALPGQRVGAAAAGVVIFAGWVVDRPLVVVSHGGRRTTYEPITPAVKVGQPVTAGETIGRVLPGHRGCPRLACLHWGLRRGREYLDPQSLFSPGPARLVPLAWGGDAPHGPAVASPAPGVVLRRPAGRVTSGFGPRIHPVTGQPSLHDGTDFAAACGSPLLAPADGTVSGAGPDGGYGLTVSIRHADAGGRSLVTRLSHAQGVSVRLGDRVRAGDVVGAVGSTGLSTGCHVHLRVEVGGRVVDPLTVLRAQARG